MWISNSILHLKTYSFQDDKCKWEIYKYGPCSVTCGGGIRYNRLRQVPKIEGSGAFCSGEKSDDEPCNTQLCPGINI